MWEVETKLHEPLSAASEPVCQLDIVTESKGMTQAQTLQYGDAGITSSFLTIGSSVQLSFNLEMFMYRFCLTAFVRLSSI